MLLVSKEEAHRRLDNIQKDMPRNGTFTYESKEYIEWRELAKARLESVFGSDSRAVADFNKILFNLCAYGADEEINRQNEKRAYEVGVVKADAFFAAWMQRIDDADEPTDRRASTTTLKSATDATVFIVHGHDDALKTEVARLLEKLGIDAVILHEQANEGGTVIEKFESHARRADFAIVLLTPDDIGYAKSKGPDSAQPRARQNVILELGYFFGVLSRKGVCALLKGNVEQPSDYVGSLYISHDDRGSWKYEIVKELKAAGINVDANKL